MIGYLNGTFPIKWPRGLLIQGWHYPSYTNMWGGIFGDYLTIFLAFTITYKCWGTEVLNAHKGYELYKLLSQIVLSCKCLFQNVPNGWVAWPTCEVIHLYIIQSNKCTFQWVTSLQQARRSSWRSADQGEPGKNSTIEAPHEPWKIACFLMKYWLKTLSQSWLGYPLVN